MNNLNEESNKLPDISLEIGLKTYALTQKFGKRPVSAALVHKYKLQDITGVPAIYLAMTWVDTVTDLHLAQKCLRELENW